MLVRSPERRGLYDPSDEPSTCGVGFITRKDGRRDHDSSTGHTSLCAIPHRGGISSEGVGDGAGVCVDLSAASSASSPVARLEPRPSASPTCSSPPTDLRADPAELTVVAG